LADRPDGRHRPQHPPPRRLRDAVLPRGPHQGRHQRGPGAGQTVQHRAVEPVRQRHPRPPPGRHPPPKFGGTPTPPRTLRLMALRPPPARGADLHVHTTHSDGVCSPCEVVVAASAVGLAALAITDHDTVSAVPVARPEAARLGIELVAGVEWTAALDGREVHILGYFVRDDGPAPRAAPARLRAARADRLAAMAGNLKRLGLWVDLDALRRAFPRATLGRRHLADWLARTRQVSGPRE